MGPSDVTLKKGNKSQGSFSSSVIMKPLHTVEIELNNYMIYRQ